MYILSLHELGQMSTVSISDQPLGGNVSGQQEFERREGKRGRSLATHDEVPNRAKQPERFDILEETDTKERYAKERGSEAGKDVDNDDAEPARAVARE